MLALLATAPTAAVARDRMAALLWPDREEEQARASLRQELSSLRRLLGPGLPIVTADASCIRIDRAALDGGFGSNADGEFLEGLDFRSEPFDDWRRLEAARLADAPLRAAATAAETAPPDDIFENPTVLVMAFTPAGSEEDDEAFATGLAMELRTSLSMWRWFPVIGPEAIGWATDRDGLLLENAGSVGASYAISGAVRRVGERIRVSASLTDIPSGHLLWSENFDGTMDDVFAMQEAIGRSVVARVTPEIGRAESARIVRQPPANITAWQLVAQTDELDRTGGEGYGTIASNRAQLPLLEQAIALEPGYARAWARLARFHFRSALLGWEEHDTAIRLGLETSAKAIEVDPNEWEGQAYRAVCLIFGAHEFEPARFHASEAVRLNPSAPLARLGSGCVLEWMGDLEEALRHLSLVFELNPMFPNRAAVLATITTCQMQLGQTEAAVETARQLLVIAPNYSRGLQRVAATLGHAGLAQDGAEILARVKELQPDFDAAYVRRTYPYARSEHLQTFLAGLRAAGWDG